jgi:putative flippase GtrA
MTFTGTSVCFSVFTVRELFAFNDETTLLNQFWAFIASFLFSCAWLLFVEWLSSRSFPLLLSEHEICENEARRWQMEREWVDSSLNRLQFKKNGLV